MTSQNKYKKKIIFDVIEEEDEDKNVMKKNNNLINMELLFKDSLTTFYDYLELLNDLIKLYYNDK